MPLWIIAFIVAALAAPVSRGWGASAAPVRNKSVELSWEELRTDKVLWSGKVSSFSIRTRLDLYISSQGKVFSQMTRVGSGKGVANISRQAGEEKPGGSLHWKISNWHFEGRALVGHQEFGPNGARRMSVEFDDNFLSCTAAIQAGRASAKNMIATYADTGEKAEVLSEEIRSPTCSVRDGNVFGN
jgi:hypothetical protein